MPQLAETVRAALDGLDIGAVDRAATELAMTYAREIDDGGDLAKLGGGLLATLESLGMTPRSRKSLTRGEDNQPVRSPLDELRERRQQRANTA